MIGHIYETDNYWIQCTYILEGEMYESIHMHNSQFIDTSPVGDFYHYISKNIQMECTYYGQ